MSGGWSWGLMALLGAYHGLNPAMGWLFAVGLGLQERSRGAVLKALGPIALGHELALGLVAGLILVLGVLTDTKPLHIGAGIVLVLFGIFRFVKPHAHPRWTTMRVRGRELTLWSFLMSSAHGAGLMVAPVLIGVGEASASTGHDHAMSEMHLGMLDLPRTALALLVHVGAMLLVMAVVAVLVYDKLGVRILRGAWLNTEWLWASAFILAGVVTFFS
jgi:hypothetical protein